MNFNIRVDDQDLSAYWGWFFSWGLLLSLLGVLAISAAAFTTLLSVVVIGFLILLSGCVLLIDSFTFWWGKWKGFILHFLVGLLYFVVGLMLINNPVLASATLTLLLGLFYILIGVSRIIFSLSIKLPRWKFSFINGLVALLLGVLITANWPASSLIINGLFVGIDLLVCGAAYMVWALYAKSLRG